MSSDDSAIFVESESPSLAQLIIEPDLNELYKHIPPPIPLIPKNKYKETMRYIDLARDERDKKFLTLPDVTKNIVANSQNHSFNDDSESNIDLSEICEGRNVVYQREPQHKGKPSISCKVKLENLWALPQIDIKPSFDKKSDSILFESRFESGNLGLALKKSDSEYDLLMQNDINTKGHTQWFYFKVFSPRSGPVKFNILNFSKTDSLFNYGMQVLILSETLKKNRNQGWYRGGTDIKYYANNIQRTPRGDTYYTLTYTYNFLYDSDIVSFAYCYPYTYTQMLKDLDGYENNHPEILTRRTLCLSISDKRCELLTITAPGSSEDLKKRRGAVISARVHPGETVGSFMMSGLIEFLLSSADEARILREMYVFKVIPMLNPDGVAYGNYRCGLSGCDLNRNWKSPSKILHPTIYAAKKMIKSFAKERTIDFICDFHGHSKKKNIFMYGCSVPDSPELTRCIPYILSKLSPFIHYPYCSFRMQKSKNSTMRITLFKETKIALVYTLEASFYGGSFGEYKDKHYTSDDLKIMGKYVAQALLIYNSDKSSGNTTESALTKEKIVNELLNNKDLLVDTAEDSSGSDSDPSEDNLQVKELESLMKVVSSAKHLEQRRKQLRDIEKKYRSFSNNKRESSSKVFSSQRKPRCVTCGDILLIGHVCVSKPKALNKIYSVTKSAALIYINANGRKVRDQASQTIKFEEAKTVSPHDILRKNKTRVSKAFHSSTRNNISDDISSLGRLWRNKNLPNIRKIL